MSPVSIESTLLLFRLKENFLVLTFIQKTVTGFSPLKISVKKAT